MMTIILAKTQTARKLADAMTAIFQVTQRGCTLLESETEAEYKGRTDEDDEDDEDDEEEDDSGGRGGT